MARAPINGDTLRWARTVSRVDPEALAVATGTSADRIEAFELGASQPTFRQLSLIAKKLDRPLGFFFAPPPETADVPETADFRSRGTDDIPSELAREMKRVEQHREAMLELSGPVERRWNIDSVTFKTAARRAAALRLQLGLTERFIPPESQANQVLNFWRGLLEHAGFMVFQTTRIPLEVFRGLSIHHDSLPIIVVNGSDSASGRIFTMFHEVAHLANQTSGLCVLEDEISAEAVANRFAADFLMPESLVRERLVAADDPIEVATRLAAGLKVSPLAAAVRLRTLHLMSEQELDLVREHSTANWRIAREQQKNSGGFVPPWRLRYRDLGESYVGAVAHALEDRRIDAVDATYLLNARWPTAEKILQEYYRTGGTE